MTTSGEQLINKDDILCIFNFKEKTYNEYPLDCAKSQYVTSTRTGKEYTSHFNMSVSEFMSYDEAVANSTVEWRDDITLWFYKIKDKTYLAGINYNVFTQPNIFSSKGVITILKRNTKHSELKEVFNLYLDNKLGIDNEGNLVPYKRGTNKKFNLKMLLK